MVERRRTLEPTNHMERTLRIRGLWKSLATLTCYYKHMGSWNFGQNISALSLIAQACRTAPRGVLSSSLLKSSRSSLMLDGSKNGRCSNLLRAKYLNRKASSACVQNSRKANISGVSGFDSLMAALDLVKRKQSVRWFKSLRVGVETSLLPAAC